MFSEYIHQRRLNEISTMIPQGNICLDIGWSEGLLTFKLAQKGKFTVGLDIASSKVKRAVQEASRDVIWEKMAFITGDCHFLPFRDKIFDTVLCTEVLEHIHNPDKCLEETARVSKKNIILSVPCFLRVLMIRKRLCALFHLENTLKEPRRVLQKIGHLRDYNYKIITLRCQKNLKGFYIRKIKGTTLGLCILPFSEKLYKKRSLWRILSTMDKILCRSKAFSQNEYPSCLIL